MCIFFIFIIIIIIIIIIFTIIFIITIIITIFIVFIITSKQAAQFPPSQIVIARKYWAVTEQVDKTFLPQKFQDFCGQFSVFRLQEVDLKSNTGLRNTAFGSTRLGKWQLCHN